VNARAYHAGLTSDVRTEVQEWFMHGDSDSTDSSDNTDAKATSSEWPAEARVVVGTIAFGMVSTTQRCYHATQYRDG
jgi:superfamily II helicase